MHTNNKASFLLQHSWKSCRNEVFFWSHAKRKPLLSSSFFIQLIHAKRSIQMVHMHIF